MLHLSKIKVKEFEKQLSFNNSQKVATVIPVFHVR